MTTRVIIILNTEWEIEHETKEQLEYAKRAIKFDMEINGMGIIEGAPVKAKRIRAVAQDLDI